jgi:glycosyltransferase involved in cell wall biosynthesis
MKNVLSLVSYQFLPAKMGGQKGIAFFNRFFCRHVNLTCVTTKKNDPVCADGYEVLNILSNSKFRYINILYFFTLRKLIREKNITHLLLEHPYYGWLGILMKYFCKVSLIVHSHNIESDRFKSMGKWWWRILASYESITYKNADTCFFINDEDKDYAIQHFNIAKRKCFTITYGFELSKPPTREEKTIARNFLQSKYGIDPQDRLLLFNGTLDYKPNLDAIEIILKKINPVLIDLHFKYKIIICGKNIPAFYNDLRGYVNQNIIFAGFVDDITTYFKGSDIFINPVIDGGGIKTKLVESLGYNMNVITTSNGAIGVPLSITGDKMLIIKNDNWQLFAEEIMKTITTGDIPVAFFEHFYWEKIAVKAATAL